MRLVRPLPRALTRTLSVLAVVAWVVQMGVLLRQAYFAAPVALAADLAHYGASAQWKGIYYRGDKIGFSVGQTVPTEDGYELKEDGRLQMTLLGASTSATRALISSCSRRMRRSFIRGSRSRAGDHRGSHGTLVMAQFLFYISKDRRFQRDRS